MSDLRRIKDRLRDVGNIERLLEAIGCEHIRDEQGGELVTAQLPERFHSENRRATQVRLNDSLSCHIRNRGDFRGDIFSLVSYLHHDKRGDEMQQDLNKSKEFICNVFGWNDLLGRQRGSIVVKDYTASLKEIINGRRRRREIRPNPTIPEETMMQYYPFDAPLPYQGWVNEGISYDTQVHYGVGFDLETKRVVFPLRNRFGQLVGVKGRIMKDEDDPDRKYLYLYRCNNRYEWFNFYHAQPHIIKHKKVYIFESEKSSMMAYGWDIHNTVAIGSSDISGEQADMIKQLGLDVEVVLCYDKDKSPAEIREQAKMFAGRKVYGMFDTDNLLGDKDAPVDKGYDVWEQLLENNVFEINL